MPAKSKSQQRLMGAVYAYIKGNLDLDKLPASFAAKIKSIADGQRKKTGDKRKYTSGMDLKAVKDYASSKHDGLPEKVTEHVISSFDEYMRIFESPDLTLNNLEPDDEDAIAFLVWNRRVYVGTEEFNNKHFNLIRYEILGKYDSIDGKDADDIYQESKYPGRLWTNSKTISFWSYPETKELLFSILKQVEKKADIKILNNGYKIEVIEFNDKLKEYIVKNLPFLNLEPKDIKKENVIIREHEMSYIDPNDREIEHLVGIDFEPTLIPVEKYNGSFQQPEELLNKHLMSFKAKEQLKRSGWGKGVGSDKYSYDSSKNIKFRHYSTQENNNKL